MSNSGGAAARRRGQILDAALQCFGRYGYRRTSMETIAKAARMSRPALYQYFTSKEEVFRAMGVRMFDAALARAEEASSGSDPVADRLYAVLTVKLDLAMGSRHGGFGRELLLGVEDVAGDLLASFQVRLIAMVETLLAKELNLDAASISAHDIAVVLHDAVTGIEHEAAGVATLQRRVRQLVTLVVGGLERRF